MSTPIRRNLLTDEDFEKYKKLYILMPDDPRGSSSLRSLSREHTGKEEDPPLYQLKDSSSIIDSRNSGKTWSDERKEYREKRKRKLGTASDPNQTLEDVIPSVEPAILPTDVVAIDPIKELKEMSRSDFENRYMPVLGDRLSRAVKRMQGDPNWMSLQDEIEFLGAYTSELMRAIAQDDGYIPQLWQELRSQMASLKKAQIRKDKPGQQEASVAIAEIIEKGSAHFDAWENVLTQIDRRARLINTESQRQARAMNSVPIQDLMIFMELLKRLLERRIIAQGMSGQLLLDAIALDISEALKGQFGG